MPDESKTNGGSIIHDRRQHPRDNDRIVKHFKKPGDEQGACCHALAARPHRND